VTSKDVIKLKMIAALLEAIDVDDDDDAREAIKQIKLLVGATDPK
jgi:hypothetical protein